MVGSDADVSLKTSYRWGIFEVVFGGKSSS
jgi:hypothetical protein